jgi:hypothetical protein
LISGNAGKKKATTFQLIGSMSTGLPTPAAMVAVALHVNEAHHGLMVWNFWLASLVVANRLPVLAQEAHHLAMGRPRTGRLESERMVTEKILAVQSGALAAGLESVLIGIEIATRTALGDVHTAGHAMSHAPARVALAAARPAHRAVAANAKRFSGARRGS